MNDFGFQPDDDFGFTPDSSTEDKKKKISIGKYDTLPGIGEAALFTLTGAAAQVGALVPTLLEAGEAISKGKFKEFGGGDRGFEKRYVQNMERMTYEPRTESGKEFAQDIGEFSNRYLVPLAGVGHLPSLKIKEGINASKAKMGFGRNEIPDKVSSAISELTKETETPVPAVADTLFVDSKGNAGTSKQLQDPGLQAALQKQALEAQRRQELSQVPQGTPMERMAKQLGAEEPGPTPNPVISNMADSLSNYVETTPGMRAADEAAAARQAQMQLDMQRQVALEQNARLRAEQEQGKLPQVPIDEAELARNSDRMANAEQMLIDDTQHVLPDTNQVIAPQYGAMDGIGRLDENGIPIKADLSMEAANLENPLQRNLWGDELGPALGNDLSLTAAIDNIPPGPQRKEAISRFFRNKQRGAVLPSTLLPERRLEDGSLLPKLKISLKTESFGVNKDSHSVMLEARDPDTGARRGFVDFAVGEDGVLRAENALVAPTMRNMGIAESLYRAARDAGYDIAPGRVQTEAGQKMVQSFVEKGLINKSNADSRPIFTPGAGIRRFNKQAGAIRPAVFLNMFPSFKNTKIVDENGMPKLMYHGTSKDAPFMDIRAGSRGAWLSDNPVSASEYAKQNDSQKITYNYDTRRYEDVNSNPHVHQVYVNVENPYKMTDADNEAYSLAPSYQSFQKDMTERAKRAGHDGIDWGGGVITVFDGSQIKSAISPEKVKGVKTPQGWRLKQGGFIKFPFGKEKEGQVLKAIPGLREKFKDYLPNEGTNEQFIDLHKNTSDVDQNAVQKLFNNLTKGSLYQSIKTENPLISRVTREFRDAYQRSQAAIQEYVHDSMAPLARKLSDSDKADIWAVMQVAEKQKAPLTPEFLQKHGFNENQIKYAMTHADVMRGMYDRLKSSMEAAGLKPVDPQVAYVASRATGDFRRFILDKDGDIVGILGSNTRWGLNKQVEKYNALNTGNKVSEERYFGGAGKNGGTTEGFMQMLDFLSDKDPKIKEFVQHVNDMMTKDAFDYMNAKSHTKAKKGIIGMEGRKPFEDAVTNAKEGMQAQMRYAETMIRWSELSEAVKNTKELLKADNGLDMPNAKAYLQGYVDNALGKNPTMMGKAFDTLAAEFGKQTGIGTSIPGAVFRGAKSAVNGLMLGFGNIGFMAANFVQPFKVMPEMKAYLQSKGIKTDFDLGTGYSYLYDAFKNTLQEGSPKQDALSKGALEYGKKYHVYSSDLFESGNTPTKGVGYYWNKATQYGPAQIEHVTRKMTYLGYVEMLRPYEKTFSKQEIYSIARDLTDTAMNNYSPLEAPMAYNAAGGAGKFMYNLMSYKHNELSRLAMFARDLGKEKAYRPFAIAIASQIAFGGLMGAIGYTEADWITKQISAAMGKPTSLTKMLLESKMSDYFKYGLFNSVGVDMTNRLGIGSIGPSEIIPGASRGLDTIKQGWETLKNPNEYNAKSLARDVLPNSVSGLVDRAWFSKTTPSGSELSMNRNKVIANAERNETDKTWKTLGMTGVNEAKQKSLAYENQRIDQIYKDKRTVALDNLSKTFFTSGKMDPEYIRDYIKAQGDVSTLTKDIERIAMEQNVPADKLQMLRNAAAQNITSMHRLLRQQGKE